MRTKIKKIITSISLLRKHRPYIGKNNHMESPRLISCPIGNLEVGDDFFSGSGLYVSTNEHCKIKVGNAVMFGPDVMILGGNHNTAFSRGHMRYNPEHDSTSKPILIESGVWVGARTIILSGASIGEGAIIGAGSLVNSRIPPYSIAVGTPARFVKHRFTEEKSLENQLKSVDSNYKLDEILAMYEE